MSASGNDDGDTFTLDEIDETFTRQDPALPLQQRHHEFELRMRQLKFLLSARSR